ncbi:claudin-23-like [Salminus brasiliensis]|uniref:claudin-23-like n=1 Tax=Salminus brasiliensis TaxID=930266 RepID=UPI003B837837
MMCTSVGICGIRPLQVSFRCDFIRLELGLFGVERSTMRSPGVVVFGLVLTPCGWLLDLTSMVAPHWRTVHNITGEDPNLILCQGIWHTCSYYGSLSGVVCDGEDEEYFDHRVIETAQRMMVASLVMAVVGLAVATLGVRCWTVRPRWTSVCLGGFVIVCSGLLAIVPVAWYAHLLTDITSPSSEIRLGICIFLGYLGGIMEVLGGFLLFVATWLYGHKGLETGPSPQGEMPWHLWRITLSGVSGGIGNGPNFRDSQEDKM